MPAAIGLKPETTWSWITSRKKTAPKPPYTTNVTRLAALNWAERKASKGRIGSGTRRSTTTKTAAATSPSVAAARTPVESPPSPAAIRA